MEIEQYKAVFKGEIAPGTSLEETKQHLAQLFKTDLARIESLFTGKPIILREGLSLEEAQRFRLGFERTGAYCIIVKTTILQETLPREPQINSTPVRTTVAVPAPQSQETSPPTPQVYEVRYQVIFKGEMLLGKEKPDVIANLSRFYKKSIPTISQLFTGDPVTIKGPTDFWSAAEHVRQFKECGAICHIQLVEPTAQTVAPPVPEPTPIVEKESQSTEAPEIEEIKTKSNSIYETLAKAYRYILADYKIEQKLKSFTNNETTMGCFYLLIIGGIIALLIWSPMRWYIGLIMGIGLVAFGSLFHKEWDLKYVDVFLSRMESLKKEDPALFLVTLNRWINDLPDNDRAKIHLINLIGTTIQENTTLKPELDRYAEIFKPVTVSETNDLKNLEKEERQEKVAARTFCPRCGSNLVNEDTRGFSWTKGIIASSLLGPLGGAIIGGSKAGELIYVCLNCNNKWKK